MDSTTDAETLKQAIANCDRDPIHIPGTIQSYGYLLVIDSAADQVVAVSANLAEALGQTPAKVLARPPRDVLTSELMHTVRNVLGHDTSAKQREYVGMHTLGERAYQVSAHRSGQHAIIELLPDSAPEADRLAPMDEARRFLALSNNVTDPVEILTTAVPRLRALVGFDRVKAYVFLPNGDGEVVAESKRAEAESFLSLRFPATDIPQRARELYASTPLRLIANVGAPDVPLVMGAGQPTDVDLSLAVLRGTEPVHIQYLANMSIGGTLSLSIIVRGKLYGLFACHSKRARVPDASALLAAELAGRLLSLQIEHALELRRQTEFRRCTALASSIFVADDSQLATGPNLTRAADNLRDVVPSDGIVMQIDSDLHRLGDTPDESACHALFALGTPDADGVHALNGLSDALPGANWNGSAGALVLTLSAQPNIRMAFLRNESTQQIAWAGAPAKQVERTVQGVQLNPRDSFSRYLQAASGRCDDWSNDNLVAARALRGALIEALGIQQALREQRHRLGLLVRELNHRVRNILSLVQSLSAQSRASATSVEHYADLLEKRIVALSGAHNLLTLSDMTGVSLRKLAELELRPFGYEEGRSHIEGPDVWLRPESGPIIALVLHELTSNAVKYGALSNATGHVRLAWARAEHGLELRWAESGGPPVSEPTSQGFGRSIIEQALPYEVSGKASLSFGADGVEAMLWLPGELLTEPPDINGISSFARAKLPLGEPAPEPASADTAANAGEATPRPALIVEDNYLVAVEGRRLLGECGFNPIDSVSTISEALHQLENSAYEFCLLDVNLQGNYSSPVARQLRHIGTPFIFATGYGSEGAEVALEFDVPALPKPVDLASLKAAIAKVCDGD